MARNHLVVVPHTHWDREWHQSFESFRARLVPLVDELLELLRSEPSYRHFMLDGQTIVVDDVAEIRPQARERIAKAVRDGRLLVGPWTVLPDEWLVSGEALIRNLRGGLAAAAALGGAMEIGYVPDQFGHVGQLPQIFAGFGFEAAVLWRGVGADVAQTLFRWEAPDGTRLLAVWLPFGYGNGALLPRDPESLAERLRFEADRLARTSPVPTLLMMNGSDHQLPQPGISEALEQAAQLLGDLSVEIGTLPGFVERVSREAPDDLPVHHGELRSGRHAPLLVGCASARMAQKRRDFRLDSLLTRHLEPLAAALASLGREPDLDMLAYAWRLVLENHPHDSICGCSIDAVHDQIDARLARAEDVVSSQLENVAEALFSRVAVPEAGFAGVEGAALVVWNPHGPGPVLVDAELELDLPLRGGRALPFHLRSADGRALPARAERLEAGAVTLDLTLPPRAVGWILPAIDREFAGGRVRDVRVRRRGRQLEVEVRTASCGAGFDAAPVRREIRERMASGEVDTVRVRARRLPRVRLRFVDALPGHGLRVFRVARGAAPAVAGTPRAGEEADRVFAESRHWRAEADTSGRVCLLHRASGKRIEDALRLVSEGDRGDEYTFDAVPDGERVEQPERVVVQPLEADDAEAGLEIRGRWRVPRGLAPDRTRRTRARVALPATLRLRLPDGVDRIDLEIELTNTAHDQRLRLEVAAPFGARRFRVESAFETAERPIAPGADDDGEQPAERPCGAVPMRSFASLDDGEHALLVAARGGEVEALPRGAGRSALALTLLRSVGWLSRDDLRARPGHAGPPIATPGAQVPGPHCLHFSIGLRRVEAPGTVAWAHRCVHPPLARVGGAGADAPLADGSRLLEVEDPDVIVSAFEPRADGGPVLRIYEAAGRARTTTLGLPLAGATRARRVDLRERPLESADLGSEPGRARVALRPAEITNLRLH